MRLAIVRATRMKCLPHILAAVLAVSTVHAHHEVTPKPKILQNGLPIVQLAAEPDEFQVFELIIPPDVGELKFTTSGGKGDCDIYVRHNVHPTLDNFDASSGNSGTNESITIQNPEAGNWYVLVDPFSAYRGVTLTGTYALAPGAVAIPRLLPAPGVYGDIAKVQLKDATKGATIRYTTDDTPVTATSPIYTAPLKFTSTTHLRVAAFGLNGAQSVEAAGDYVIQPKGGVTPLTSNVPLFHRCGLTGSKQMFKITVPPDQKFLRIFTEGGPGDTDLFARRTLPPTTTQFQYRTNGRRNFNALTIKDPKPGDWFIMLRGRSNFSGVSIVATPRSEKADLITWGGAIDPYVSADEVFTEEDCEVQEGFTTAGTHTFLRFNTETRNIGGSDLVLPDPASRPDLFEFAACHGHYHFKGFASYRLLDANSQPVALGKKVSFCLEDIKRWDPTAKTNFRYSCSEQGIQSGWADVYDAGLPGQWIDITGVPNGTYTLEITMNPLHALDEADFTNNTVTTQVVLGN